MTWFHWEQNDLILHLRIQPKASRDAFIGPYGKNQYKIAITAPPVDGKANRHLVKFLAKAFAVPPSRIELITGKNARNKSIRLKSPQVLPIDFED
ncbi:MAG: DUF167 family protein [Candidatus Thiodiazotropha sp.]